MDLEEVQRGSTKNLKKLDAEQGFWQKRPKTFKNVMFDHPRNLKKRGAEQGFGNNAQNPCSASRFDPPRNQWIP